MTDAFAPRLADEAELAGAFSPRLAALAHAGAAARVGQHDKLGEFASAVACALVYVGDEIRALREATQGDGKGENG